MAWTRGSNNVFRIPSLSIFLSKFFPIFHSKSSIIPAEEKESFTFSTFPIKTPRFKFHWPGQGHISVPVVRWSVVRRGILAQPKLHGLRVFQRKTEVLLPQQRRTNTGQHKAKNIHHISATYLRMKCNLDMYNLVNITEIANCSPISFSLSFFQ